MKSGDMRRSSNANSLPLVSVGFALLNAIQNQSRKAPKNTHVLSTSTFQGIQRKCLSMIYSYHLYRSHSIFFIFSCPPSLPLSLFLAAFTFCSSIPRGLFFKRNEMMKRRRREKKRTFTPTCNTHHVQKITKGNKFSMSQKFKLGKMLISD